MNNIFGINDKLIHQAGLSEEKCFKRFKEIQKNAQYNQDKVLYAFKKNTVSESHFNPSTGYGYSDRGRDVLDCVFADTFNTQDALVRHSFVSGTHALTVALFGILRPGDTLLSVTSKPYDTLDAVIGIRKASGSLVDFGINYRQVDFKNNEIDYNGIKAALTNDVKVVFIQRSKGYSLRKALNIDEIGKIVEFVKNINSKVIVAVDNCYGEFVEQREPTEVGADLIIGSLIKNPGGGLARTGGYIAGKKVLVEECAYRLTAPEIGKECGASLDEKRNIFQGLFLAPHVVSQALKTTVFASVLFGDLGYNTTPSLNEKLTDIIGTITFNDPDKALAFCRGIQSGSPIDSFATPESAYMPGYEDNVVMAAGTFIQGASIELSADAAMRPPFTVYFQGGLTYESGKTGILHAANKLDYIL